MADVMLHDDWASRTAESWDEWFKYLTKFGHVSAGAVLTELFQAYVDQELAKKGVKRKVLIATGDSFFLNIEKLVQQQEDCHFAVVAPGIQAYWGLTKKFEGFSNVEFVRADIHERDAQLESYDLILAVPAFLQRQMVGKDTGFCSRYYAFVVMENLLTHLNRQGKLVMVVPKRFGYAGGGVKRLREKVISQYGVELLADLPHSMLMGTAIQTMLVALTAEKQRETTLRVYKATDGKPREVLDVAVQQERIVERSELEDRDNWDVGRFFISDDERWQKYEASTLSKVALGTIAKVFRGKAMPARKKGADDCGEAGTAGATAPGTETFGVVNISNLGTHEVNFEGADTVVGDARKMAGHVLKNGDVIITARGTVIRVVIYWQPEGRRYIASANLVVIRPDFDKVTSSHLKLFLDSAVGRLLIEQTQQGTVVMNISPKDLAMIEVPLLTLDEQWNRENRYRAELIRYENAIKAANNRWKHVIKELQEF